jgi:hypothetical protein
MKVYRLIAVACLLFTAGFPLVAKSVAASTETCPACKMPMPMKMTGMYTSPLYVNGKKYYCCSACPAGKKAAAYAKSHHGKLLMVTTK